MAIVFADGSYGNVRRIQEENYGNRLIASDLANPDFVKYAESYGAIGHRVKHTDDLVPTMEGAFKDTGVHLITVPIDYVENTRVLVEELRGRVPEIA